MLQGKGLGQLEDKPTRQQEAAGGHMLPRRQVRLGKIFPDRLAVRHDEAGRFAPLAVKVESDPQLCVIKSQRNLHPGPID